MNDPHVAVAEVKEQVLQAFTGLSPPDPAVLIAASYSERDRAGEEALREQLAGKHWSTLDTAYLKDRWSAFCYLSAEGYRYYLPALLIACLDDFSQSNELIHSTVYSLVPSFGDIYCNGQDESFRIQTSTFDCDQGLAVCSFLGLTSSPPIGLRYLSGQALRWGWNRHEHPALAAAVRYFHELRSYDRPTSNDRAVRSLIEQIETAFRDTPYPGDENLTASFQGDEPFDYALEFRGADWRRLHPDFLAMNYACLCFFTDEAFRYYLPAYLIEDLLGSESNANPVFNLTYGLTGPSWLGAKSNANPNFHLTIGLTETKWLEHCGRQSIDRTSFSHFTREERTAIVAYLERMRKREPDDDIDQALERYWLPSLKG